MYSEKAIGRLLEHSQGYAVVAYQPGPRQLSELQAHLASSQLVLEAKAAARSYRLFDDHASALAAKNVLAAALAANWG